MMLAACAAAPNPPTTAEEAAALQALALLRAADDSTLVRAFTEVNAHAHSRLSRITQQIGTRPAATATRLVRQEPQGDAEVASLSETGAFSEGFSGASPNMVSIYDLAGHIVEADPHHLSTRFSEDFVYRMLPDTVLWKRPVQVVAIEARPHSTQPVRKAYYYLDQGTLAAIYLVRTRRTMFFSEHTRYYVQVRPVAQRWVPYQIGLSTELTFPLRPTRRLSRSATLFAYGGSAS